MVAFPNSLVVHRSSPSQARLNRYEELANAAAPRELSSRGSIYIPPGPRLGDVVVSAKGVNKAFGEKVLLRDVSFDLPPGSIVGVVGPNGAGKTTLVNMITGSDKPDSGNLEVGQTVNMVAVGQDRMDGLNGDKSAFEEISDGLDEIELGTQSVSSRAYCSWFGLRSNLQQSKVKDLSGGERNR